MSSHNVGSVERALKILEELGATQKARGLTFSEIKERMEERIGKIPKSTLSYLLRTLVKTGYVRFNTKTKQHTLGLPLVTLGNQVRRSMRLPEQDSLWLLKTILKETKFGAHLAEFDLGYAVYVDRVEAPGFFEAKIWPGKRQIPHVTAVGKALVCGFSEDQLKELLAQHASSQKEYPKAITSLSGLTEHLAEVRERGYAFDDEEHAENVRCVAAPVYAATGEVLWAIGISGTKIELPSQEKMHKIGKYLRGKADDLAKQLSHSSNLQKQLSNLPTG